MARTLQGVVEPGRGGPVAEIRRPWWSRLSSGHLLIAVIGVLAFLLNLMVLRGATTAELFAVAATDIPAGSTLAPSMVRYVEVGASPDFTSRLLSEADVSSRWGHILARSVSAGDPVTAASLLAPAGRDGMRVMSLPVDVEHAVGGRVVPGDRVDVVAVVEGAARFVATDLEVVAVPDSNRGGLGATGAFFVVLAVDAQTALDLAEVAAAHRIEIILATGAAQIGGER